MHRLATIAAGWALCVLPAQAEPFTVDHLLAQEQLGPVSLDPSQRWLVVQSFGPWASAPRFDLDDLSRYGVGRVQVFDLAAGGQERPLLLPPGAGYVAGPASPDGRRLALCRLVGRDWELGVVDLVTGQATWLGVTPRLPVWGKTLAWRSPSVLIAATRDPAAPETNFGLGWRGQDRVAAGWAATARGAPGLTVSGSGRYLDLRPQSAPGWLMAFDLVKGEHRTLARGEVLDLEVAPRGGAVAAVVAGQDIQPQGDEVVTTGTPIQRRRLLLVDLISGAAREPCLGCDLMARFLSWSPSGKSLLVFARPSHTRGANDWSQAAYWRVETLGGAALPLTTEGHRPALDKTPDNGVMARGGWLADAPVVPLQPIGAGRSDWFRVTSRGLTNLTQTLPGPASVIAADPDEWVMRGDGRAWRVTRTSVRRLPFPADRIWTPPPSEDGERLARNTPPASRSVVTLAGAPLGSSARTWDGAGLPPLAPQSRLLAVRAGGRQVVDLQRDAHGVTRVGLSTIGKPRQVLVTVNADLDRVDFVEAVAVPHQGVDGEALTSWLYLPTGVPPKGGWPVVLIPYPGEPLARAPAGQAAPAARLVTNAQILAAQGYAVLVPAVPVRPGKEPMEGLAAQMLAALDAAAAAHPIDPNRAAIWGHSYGAYAAVAAATQSGRFKAIIASAATTNLVGAYGRVFPMAAANPEVGLPIAPSAGWLETGQARMGAPPWAAPERYMRNSPVMFADKITVPVLMLYGDNDKDLAQPQGLFSALYRQGRDAILVTYRGEGHVVSSPGNVRDQYARIFAFLDETLAFPSEP